MIRPALAANVWPVADQVLISASNFFTTILLARGLSVSEFGRFTLVFSLLLFANSIQAGLITQPHNVLGVVRCGQDYARYTTATALSQLAVILIGVLLILAVAATGRLFQWEAVYLCLALAPALAAWQLQEFARRVLYTEERYAAAFVNDLLAYSATAVGIAVLARHGELTAPRVLGLIGLGSLAGALLGMWQLRASLTRSLDWSAVRDNWHYGKWLLGGEVIGQWLATQVLVCLAAAALGAAAAGVLRAVHTLLGPARLLAQVFSATLPTRLARALEAGGDRPMLARLRSALLVAIPLLGGYCLLVALFAGPLLSLAFGEKYAQHGSVLALYAATAFVGYLTMLAAAALRAKRLTREIFMAEVLSLLIVPLGALLVPSLGIHGVVLGMMAADAALLGLLWRFYAAKPDFQPTFSELASKSPLI